MLNPWLILGTLAFVASFVVSLTLTHDLGAALIAAATSLATAFLTAALVNIYHNRSATSRIATLKHQVYQLRQQKLDAQQAVAELVTEQERVAASLYSMQDQLRQRQLPAHPSYALPAPSWDLSTTAAVPASVAIAPDLQAASDSSAPPTEFHPDSLQQFITEAAATKQKITASLNHLQSELNHVNTQVQEQRQRREHLHQDIARLQQQQQHLTNTVQQLNQEMAQRQHARAEFDRAIAAATAKQQELEAGTTPLQKALQQLQSQVAALQTELRSLETQITAKRDEKTRLEQIEQVQNAELRDRQQQLAQLATQITQLTTQKTELEGSLEILDAQHGQMTQADMQALLQQKTQLEQELDRLKAEYIQAQAQQATLQQLDAQIRDRQHEKTTLEQRIAQLQAEVTALQQVAKLNDPLGSPSTPAAASAPTAVNLSENGPYPVLERPVRPSNPSPAPDTATDDDADSELPDRWTEFMVQLPEYELQALKAIAHNQQVFRQLNQIADDHLTTPEELIAAINQLAEEIIGEPVIHVRKSAPPVIARDHQRTIKKLIATYEYLTDT